MRTIAAPITYLAVGLAFGWVCRGVLVADHVTLAAVEEVRLIDIDTALLARVDTGAAFSSIHCPPEMIEGQLSDIPFDNLGKRILFFVIGLDGESKEIGAEIVDYSQIKTTSETKHRYHIRLKVACGGVVKNTLVTLNDRSRMRYSFLLGRDFLSDDCLSDDCDVNVSKDGNGVL